MRPRQGLHACDVIDMDVEQGADRRDGDFIQIDTARRKSAPRKAITAGRDPAEEQLRLAGTKGLVADAWKLFGVIVERLHLVLLQRRGRQRLQADRNPLDALGALLRGDDDVSVRSTLAGSRWHLICSSRIGLTAGCRCLLGESWRNDAEAGQHCRREQKSGPAAIISIICEHLDSPCMFILLPVVVRIDPC